MKLLNPTRRTVQVLATAIVVLASTVAVAKEEPVWLVTEGEAMLPAPAMPRSAPDLPNNGPMIRIQSPSMEGALSPPFPVEVLFEPRPGGSAVKVDSLKVTYLKFIEIDVTERFKPYIKENRLFVEKANVPVGRHRLKVSISDQQGNTTAAIINVTVK